ncbi:hypothetical protein L207DRAFT_636434 [Hyaloscypha variabilis F]|uniref:DUF6594 domain-containing protein n=1 Tax=Hyaloscypha variabilis (strain UAMH 11265 / GT02V1 / F) TaxID=1149755 RepID=A0A2J6RD61_HYAVF|nr:hypothetical protein L207DRAFT_636434 [Hyaloscypha variabilis F]
MAQRQPDIEMQNARKKVIVNGYPSLADFIAKDKERSTSIYRSYHRLTSRNLLYLEAELFDLEKRQDELDEQDLKGDLTSKQYAIDWSRLSTSDDERCVERRELLTMCRAKIKEYQDALIAQETILKMMKPHRRTVEAFQSWMEGEADGRGVPVITGLSANRLLDASDLIALHPPVDQDWLTRFVRRYFRILFVEGKIEGSLAHFSETRISYAVAVLSILLAAILLVGSIVNLYLVQDNLKRLGLVGVYTAVFAASVGILSNARRAELFASTAAYAAVLVVFVSGNLAAP